ncbi:MAG: YbbR-like domain-containing protein [Bacteroidota bacterium]
MATSPSNSSSSPFWEWIQSFFSRQRRTKSETPEPRRGLIITVCVLVSAFLWFTFTIRGTYTATISMPTQVRNVPDGQALATLPPDEVRVQVEGEGFSLIRLNYNPPTIPIDASEDVVNIEEAVRQLPQNVRITGVSPSTFNLRKEPQMSRQIPVRSRVEVQTPPTHDLLEPVSLTPDSIRVSGARSIVGDLDAWPTQEQVFRDVRDSLRAVVPLADTLANLVRRSHDAVRVDAESRRFTEGIREIPVTVIGGPEQAVTLDPPTVHVSFRVLFSQYDEAMEAPDFFATVSFDEILADTTGRIRPELNLPDGVVLRDVRRIPPIHRYYQRLE